MIIFGISQVIKSCFEKHITDLYGSNKRCLMWYSWVNRPNIYIILSLADQIYVFIFHGTLFYNFYGWETHQITWYTSCPDVCDVYCVRWMTLYLNNICRYIVIVLYCYFVLYCNQNVVYRNVLNRYLFTVVVHSSANLTHFNHHSVFRFTSSFCVVHTLRLFQNEIAWMHGMRQF